MSMRLAITAGPDKGRSLSFTEGETLVIGRGRTATARLRDPCVSRIYCQVRADRDEVLLADCNSTAGTFLNSEQIEEQSLQPGDVIRVGDTEFRFELEAAADKAKAAAKREVAVEAKPAPKHELDDLAGKKLGLLCNNKRAAPLILETTERLIKEKFPTAELSWFYAQSFSVSSLEKERAGEFDDWIKGIDAVIAAVGD